MSRSANITLDFGDGTYPFALTWGGLMELQEKCDAGPFVIYDRLANLTCKVEDIREPIRIGLIGGGMQPVPALKLVQQYVEKRPLVENRIVAQAILSVAIVGAPEEEVGKKAETADQSGSTISPTERSDSPSSSGSEPRSGSRRKRSKP
ncbi:MAG: gene transfer agent family protein [Parvibaculaceae bacterium]